MGFSLYRETVMSTDKFNLNLNHDQEILQKNYEAKKFVAIF